MTVGYPRKKRKKSQMGKEGEKELLGPMVRDERNPKVSKMGEGGGVNNSLISLILWHPLL